MWARLLRGEDIVVLDPSRRLGQCGRNGCIVEKPGFGAGTAHDRGQFRPYRRPKAGNAGHEDVCVDWPVTYLN
ncbi:hypothetical protein D9M69_173420 [compost metagenome]